MSTPSVRYSIGVPDCLTIALLATKLGTPFRHPIHPTSHSDRPPRLSRAAPEEIPAHRLVSARSPAPIVNGEPGKLPPPLIPLFVSTVGHGFLSGRFWAA